MIKTFTITKREIEQGQPVLTSKRLLDEMIRAGVPVVGVLWPMGVTAGTLQSVYDEVFEEFTYTWNSEP